MIKFPLRIQNLLTHSRLSTPIRSLADQVGEILIDNKMPFFQDYTDHGIDHINNVLQSQVELIPEEVWERNESESHPKILSDADAAVIVGATLLHDLAMHLREQGFLELIHEHSRFKPLYWFKDENEYYVADRPWHELWADYTIEVRKFNVRTLSKIIGEKEALNWRFDNLPEYAGKWENNHKLIIGEFIRRHHARLAHEIAIYGFPGLKAGNNNDEFPAMGEIDAEHPLKDLADLIGLTARSHGTSLRVCKAYLDSHHAYGDNPTPMNTAVLYPMALLRIADYLQIEHDRAPSVLLRLREPQSPVSVAEWKKHKAVRHIGPAKDPRAKMITVSDNINLSIYLQLKELLVGLQTEIDHSTAVLDETYGTRRDLGLNHLSLSIRRIYHKLDSPDFKNRLPYFTEKTGFAADPNLLALLVEPLYGRSPEIGVRELLQNAVDAVRELHVWCKNRELSPERLDLNNLETDVLVEFIKKDNGQWVLHVTDKGIGMTPETIQHFFLRAGVSFRNSQEWIKENTDEVGDSIVMRTGRFGVGAFALFLLGPTFRLYTRHASSKVIGYSIEASMNSQLIELTKEQGLKIGTKIEVEISESAVGILKLNEKIVRELISEHYEYDERLDWYCLDWPSVQIRLSSGGIVRKIPQRYRVPSSEDLLPATWSVIYPKSFGAVFWTFEGFYLISCNGIKIPDKNFSKNLSYPISLPPMVIFDKNSHLPLTIQRDKIIGDLPFMNDLVEDVVLSIIAHAIICGPTSLQEALCCNICHPISYLDIYTNKNLFWCATNTHFVLSDKILLSMLQAHSLVIHGTITDALGKFNYNHIQDFFDNYDQSKKSIVFSPFKNHFFNRNAYRTDINISERICSDLDKFVILAESATITVSSDMSDINYNQNSLGSYKSNYYDLFKSVVWKREANNKSEILNGVYNNHKAKISHNDHIFLMKKLMPERYKNSHISYVMEIEVHFDNGEPDSTISKLWLECLGAVAIPFNPFERQELIEKAQRNIKLSRHIQKWVELKNTDSK